MKYFVTGATGFIGGYVTKQLLQAGHEVTALVRNPQKAKYLSEMGVKLFEGDITDKESIRAPMTGVDGIFHLAAWYKIGIKEKMAEKINVEGTKNVLELMKELRIKKGVYTSSCAVFSNTKGKIVDETYRYDGEHLSVYDLTKWKAHYEIAEPMMKAGLPLVIVQPGVVYGPGDTSSVEQTFKQYLLGRLPSIPKGTGFCWSYIEDVARGHLLAMEKGKPGESYIIAGPPHTMEDVLNISEKITGIKGPKIKVGPGTLKFMSKVMGVVESVIPVPEFYTAENLRVIAGVTYWATNEKAKRELGYNARPIEEGLRETLIPLMKELGISSVR